MHTNSLEPFPKVSIIIPAYNPGRFLDGALRSVCSQTYKNWEAFVIDDGSSEDLTEVCNKFPNITLIRQPHRGAASARNAGVLNSTGALIAFLDADDVWHPTKLANQVICMTKDSRIGLSYTGVEFIDSNNEPASSYGVPSDQPAVERASKGLTRLGDSNHLSDNRCATEEDWDLVSFEESDHNRKPLSEFADENFYTPTVMIRRDCLAAAGLFDPHLRCGEDTDLWIRIGMHYKIGRIKSTEVLVRRHQGSLTDDLGLLVQQNLLMSQKYDRLARDRRCEELASLSRRLYKNTLYHYGVRAYEKSRLGLRQRDLKSFLQNLQLAWAWNPKFVLQSVCCWAKARVLSRPRY